MIKVKTNRSSCPISTALEIIGDQWSLIIIRDLFLERTTFSEFRDSPEKIATNVLTNRLNKLLDMGLIGYVLNPNNKKIKVYYLEDSGIDLYPLIFDLSMWSKKHLDMKFHPISEEWYKITEKKTSSKVISSSSKKYRVFRESTLNKMAL
tara:strand:- start:1460 stop:1909 length:450 start_codon:yes stop_codon:yes gene_type:complete